MVRTALRDRLWQAAGAGCAAVALLVVIAVVWLVRAEGTSELLLAPVLGTVPYLVLLLLAVPVTTVLCGRPLTLVGFGGAVLVALDASVLALLVWVGMWTPAGDVDVLLPGAVAWCCWLVGVALAEVLAVKRRLAVRTFNVGLAGIAGALFILTIHGVRNGTLDLFGVVDQAAIGPWDLAAVGAASAVYVATDLVLSAVFVVWAEGGRIRDVLGDPAGLVAGAAVLAVTATAVLAAVLLREAPWTLLLLAPVGGALFHAAQVGTAALTERTRADALYAGANGCQTATSRDEIVAAVVAAATQATASRSAVTDVAPTDAQIGSSFMDGEHARWLVSGPRPNGHAFLEGDRTALATLAAMAAQSLARVAGLEQIRRLAERDGLTGLLNRAAFTATLNRVVSDNTSLLFCDVDAFKAVNDTFGHRHGDDVLVAVAQRLLSAVRPGDVVARLGGDEFVVLLPDSSPQEAAAVQQRLLSELTTPVHLAGTSLNVQLSVGVASSADLTGIDPTEVVDAARLGELLLDRADTAMYAVKRQRSAPPVSMVLND